LRLHEGMKFLKAASEGESPYSVEKGERSGKRGILQEGAAWFGGGEESLGQIWSELRALSPTPEKSPVKKVLIEKARLSTGKGALGGEGRNVSGRGGAQKHWGKGPKTHSQSGGCDRSKGGRVTRKKSTSERGSPFMRGAKAEAKKIEAHNITSKGIPAERMVVTGV